MSYVWARYPGLNFNGLEFDGMNLKGLSISQLLALQALLKTSSISLAAQKCFITKPAMSLTLKKLRITFDDALLIKSIKGFEPTAYALQLLPQLDEILSKITNLGMKNSTFDPRIHKREFTLGIPDFYESLVLDHLLMLSKTYDYNVKFEIKRLNYITDHIFTKWSLDLSISIAIEALNLPDNLETQKIANDELHYCVKKGGVLDQEPLTLPMYLDTNHIIMRNHVRATNSYVDRFLNRDNQQRNIIAIAASVNAAVLSQIKSDHVLISGPQSMFRIMAKYFPIAHYPLPLKPNASCEVYAIWQKKDESDPAIHWLVNEMTQAFNKTTQNSRQNTHLHTTHAES